MQATLWFLGFKDGQRLSPRLSLPRFLSWSEAQRNLAAYNDIVDLHALLLNSKRPVDATDAELRADSPESLSFFEEDLSPELRVLQGGKQSERQGAADSESSFRPRLVASNLPLPCDSSAHGEATAVPTARSRRWHIAGFAAACAGVALAVIYLSGMLSGFSEKAFVTVPGEQRVVSLADGSQVTMGGATEVRVRFTRDLRAIELNHGEALFNVTHDPKRPFVVHAGAGIITAVGTEFLVRRYWRYSDRIEVCVTRGVVQVAPLHGVTLSVPSLLSSVSWAPMRLASGEQMSYTDRGSATAIKRSDAQPAAELTEGTFIYHGRPLGEVIEDVQRYTPDTITLDSQAAKLAYSGSVLERDVRQWLRGLPQIFPGLAITQAPDHIAIRYDPRASDAASAALPTGANP